MIGRGDEHRIDTLVVQNASQIFDGLPVGTEFLFKLSLPKRDRPFELRGAVIWTNQPSDIQEPSNPNMGMGIRFIFEDQSDRDKFEDEVQDLMVASLGPYLFKKLVGDKSNGS